MSNQPKEQVLRDEWRKEFDPLLSGTDIPWQVRQRMEEWADKKLSTTRREVLESATQELKREMTTFEIDTVGGKQEVWLKEDVLSLLSPNK